MKRIKLLLFVAILLFPVYLNAKQISLETATQVAEAQVRSRIQLRSDQKPELNLVYIETNGNKTLSSQAKVNVNAPADVLYYVFNIGENGFIIISGDDIAVPVLGYSDEGAYDPDNLPPNFVYWMDFLANEIKEAIEKGFSQDEKTKEQWVDYLSGKVISLRATHNVNPLLNEEGIAWDQYAPYYDKCPMDGSNRSVTGCVATAMAQIMRFHKYPNVGTGIIPGYTTKDKGLNVDPVNLSDFPYQWSKMLPKYSPGSSDEREAVAYLMSHCGASVKMNYSYRGSSAYSWAAGWSLINYFSYNKSLTYKQRRYYSNTEWVNILKEQIDNRQPVLYSGQGADGGHSFVCDGYDENYGPGGIYFYFNWGWGGAENGYFTTTALSTSAGSFNNSQDILMNIIRNSSGEQSIEIGLNSNSGIPTLSSDQNQVNHNQTFTVNASFFFNYSFSDFVGNTGFALYDINTNQIVYSRVTASANIPAFDIDRAVFSGNGWGFNGSVPSTVLPGVYLIKPVVRTASSEIIPVRLPDGFNPPSLTVKGVVLDNSTLNLIRGDKAQLTPTIYISPIPTNITWSSDRTDIASVDGNGLVTGVSAGTAIITVTVVDGTSTYKASCSVLVSNPPVFVWKGSNGLDGSDWTKDYNWKDGKAPTSSDIAIIPDPDKVVNFPKLTQNTTVAEIHFEPGAQIENQSLLDGKAFVQYDLSEANNKRDRWLMLSTALMQVYPGDFTFSGYPSTWVRTFQNTNNGGSGLAKGSWVTLRSEEGSKKAFSAGDGFVLWLNSDSGDPNNPVDASGKGLKLLDKQFIELPFFQHQAQDSPNRAFYDMVRHAHTFDGAQSTFYEFIFNTASKKYERGSQNYSVPRTNDAYKLAGAGFSKNLDFADGYFALAGNPFMASLDFGQLYKANSTKIKPVYHIWTGSSYETYEYPDGPSGIIGTVPLDSIIAPLQGFIIEKYTSIPMPSAQFRNTNQTTFYVDEPALSTIQFSESMAKANKDAVLRSTVNPGNKLDIVARNTVAGVRTFIANREGGQAGFGNSDARKIINSISNIPEIYTLKPYKEGLIATTINIINGGDLLIPLGLATSYAGNISLTFSGMDSYNANIYLIDAETNKTIDLTGLLSYVYTFNFTPKKINGETVACEDRFLIRISKTVTGLNETIAEKVYVYESNRLIRIVSGASNPIKEIAVYDMQGVLIHKETSLNTISHSVNRILPAGIYLVKVISEQNTDNVKLIIR